MSDKQATPPPMRKLTQLKLRLQSLLKPLKPFAKAAPRVTVSVLSVVALLFISARVPEMHDQYLRNYVGSRVFQIKGQMKGGGGTGFQVKAPSGANYIVTNSHVCDYVKNFSEDKSSVLVLSNDQSVVRRRIIVISDQSDLCLIEGIPGLEGLPVGSEPGVGEAVSVIGYPMLRPLTLAKGEVIGKHDVEIVDHIITTGDELLDLLSGANPTAKCDLPKNRIVEEPIIMTVSGMPPEKVGVVKICIVVTKGAYMSTAVIFPGNSGSPVVDFWGNVVAVAFASDQTNWGSLVSIDDLQDFLSRY